jgi:hypothetical protein
MMNNSNKSLEPPLAAQQVGCRWAGGFRVGPRQLFDIVDEPENNEWFFLF